MLDELVNRLLAPDGGTVGLTSPSCGVGTDYYYL